MASPPRNLAAPHYHPDIKGWKGWVCLDGADCGLLGDRPPVFRQKKRHPPAPRVRLARKKPRSQRPSPRRPVGDPPTPATPFAGDAPADSDATPPAPPIADLPAALRAAKCIVALLEDAVRSESR
jgi:hypothetical protein